jgi:hypothetical protein
MAKAKPKATIMVADGAGGMAKVQDRRFEAGDWPIRFDVPGEQADSWLKYFYAECEKRGWSSSGIGQFEARENSSSITVNAGGADDLQLAVVWERKRGGPLHVRARSAGVPEFPFTDAQKLFEQVNEQFQSGAMEQIYRRHQLEYEGLPWRASSGWTTLSGLAHPRFKMKQLSWGRESLSSMPWLSAWAELILFMLSTRSSVNCLPS